MKWTWVIADIHGEWDKLQAVLEKMRSAGFDLADPEQTLVQLGDRNDRGDDSYKVIEWFKTQQIMFPGQVICLLGNHDRMMIDAAEGRSDLMYWNGGYRTARSYMHVINNGTHHGNSYFARFFPSAMRASGHLDWLKTLPKYYETSEYFFSHAPIPKEEFRTIPIGLDFRQDEQTLTWSYIDERTERWVDPNLVPIEEDGNFYGKYKTCVYGHIHGIRYAPDPQVPAVRTVVVPGPRVHGHAILMDTGAGCHPDGYVSCLRMEDRVVFTSKGDSFSLDEHVRIEQEAARERAKRELREQLYGGQEDT